MPQRKSVRFEDIDDEPEGGFGLKVSQWSINSVRFDSVWEYSIVLGGLALVIVCVEARPSHHTPSGCLPTHHPPHRIESTTTTTTNTQGILTNLYATLSGYGKWARTHSKSALSWGVTIGWYIATATIITAMPLLLEVRGWFGVCVCMFFQKHWCAPRCCLPWPSLHTPLQRARAHTHTPLHPQ